MNDRKFPGLNAANSLLIMLLGYKVMHIGEHQVHYYEALGECMYCRSKDELTDEHIIPYGLWGKMVLPKSSCKACAAITSEFERRVLRGFMHEGRIVGNSPSRRKKRRPKTISKSIFDPGERLSVRPVPGGEAFSQITMPVFEVAGILSGRPLTKALRLRRSNK